MDWHLVQLVFRLSRDNLLFRKKKFNLIETFTVFKHHLAMSSAIDKQLFWGRLSDKVRATSPKGIVGGFEFTVFQRNLKKWQDIWLQVVKEINKSRFVRYTVRNHVLIISHTTFWDCHMHIFSDNLSQNSYVYKFFKHNSHKSKQQTQDVCDWKECFTFTGLKAHIV